MTDHCEYDISQRRYHEQLVDLCSKLQPRLLNLSSPGPASLLTTLYSEKSVLDESIYRNGRISGGDLGVRRRLVAGFVDSCCGTDVFDRSVSMEKEKELACCIKRRWEEGTILDGW